MLVRGLCSLGEHASTNHGTFSFQVVGVGCPSLVGRACLFHMLSFDHLMASTFGYFFAVWWTLLVTASSEVRVETFLTWFSGLNWSWAYHLCTDETSFIGTKIGLMVIGCFFQSSHSGMSLSSCASPSSGGTRCSCIGCAC